MTNTTLKPVTRQVVEIVSLYLMLAKGETTTLEVKKHLRKLGYEANQEDISVEMGAIENGEDITYDLCMQIKSTGKFRVYHLVDSDEINVSSNDDDDDEDTNSCHHTSLWNN